MRDRGRKPRPGDTLSQSIPTVPLSLQGPQSCQEAWPQSRKAPYQRTEDSMSQAASGRHVTTHPDLFPGRRREAGTQAERTPVCTRAHSPEPQPWAHTPQRCSQTRATERFRHNSQRHTSQVPPKNNPKLPKNGSLDHRGFRTQRRPRRAQEQRQGQPRTAASRGRHTHPGAHAHSSTHVLRAGTQTHTHPDCTACRQLPGLSSGLLGRQGGRGVEEYSRISTQSRFRNAGASAIPS